jgi:hypothetical protein
MELRALSSRRPRRRWGAPVVLLTAAVLAGACTRPGGGGGGPTTPPPTNDPGDPGDPVGGGSLPPVASTDADGPFAVTVDSRAGANSTVFRPTNLGQNGVKHPIFVWGTGSTTQPSAYNFHFRRMASHGFVIISPNSASVTGQLLKNSLSWIIGQNTAAGIYQGKLDTAHIAMGGHSLGSIATFDAEATLNNLTTTLHIGGGSFDGQGSRKVKTPTAYICGATDIALSNCKRDFQNVGSQPTFFSTLAGTDHIYAARNGLPAMIAWLRWQLAGETQRKAEFSPGGKFFTGIFQSQVKNWN